MTDSESSRDRSRSRSPLRNDGPKKRRVFTPSPVRNEDEQTIYEVPTEFKRAPNFLANLLFSGSPGNFKIEEGLSFAKYLYEESVTNDINAGYAGECLPFGYVSFLELMGDIAKNFEFNYSLFISDSLKNNWEEAVVDVKEDRLEFYRGPSEENFYAKIAYDDIYHLSPLVEGITFNIFYENGKVLRVMHERLEVATIVYYMLWKVSENGRKKHTEIKKGDNNVDWEKFPEEVLSSIFERHVSSLRELGNVARVSKKFFNAAFGYDNKNMWKKLYSLEFNEIPYFKSGTDIDWRSLVHERCLIRKKSAYDALRCVSVWQRDLKIRCGLTFFDTHVFNCAMFSGKWYYEFIMPETGIDAIQVGITTVLSKPFYHVGFEYFGVGDDDFSWSYDGVRSQKFHGNTVGNTQYWQDSYKWGPGDCIRVAMNIDDGELKFLHNHNDLGTAYNFPIKKKVYDFPEGEEIKEPFLPYFPAITCQQSSYGGEVTPQVIIQRAKMRYGPPEGYTSIGELMTERQFVDKISLTHVPDSMVGLMISKQLQVYIDELSSKGLIETPPPLENVGVDAGVYAQNFSVPKPSNNDYGFDFY